MRTRSSRSRSIARRDLVEAGETEAWVVLEAGHESRIYAGLMPGTTADGLRHALATGTIAERLASFAPKTGDAVFLPAGTVHSLGADVVVFEVQQNSDVNFRWYGWNRVDAESERLATLSLLPTCGTKFRRYDGDVATTGMEGTLLRAADRRGKGDDRRRNPERRCRSRRGGRKDVGRNHRRPSDPDHLFRPRPGGAPRCQAEMGPRA